MVDAPARAERTGLTARERRYNVSRDPDGRAFAGLSLGGQITSSPMLKYPELFGYYGMFSSGLRTAYTTLTGAEAAALKIRVHRRPLAGPDP